MGAEKLDAILGSDVEQMIPESKYLPVIHESAVTLMPENDSASLVPVNDSYEVASGISGLKNGHVRRNSTGNISIPYKTVKVLSRYLAASTGSCHDNCKYGMRQDVETKTPNSPILGTRMEKQGKGLEIGRTTTLADRKSKSEISVPHSPGFRNQKPDFLVSTRSGILSPAKRETALSKHFSLQLKGKVSDANPMLSRSSTLPAKKQSDELERDKEIRYSHGATSSKEQNKLASIEEMKAPASNEKKIEARANVSLSALQTVKKVLKRPVVSLSPKHPRNKVSDMEAEKINNLKMVSHLNDGNDVAKAETEQPSRKDVLQKNMNVNVLNQKSVSPASPSSPYKDKTPKNARVSSPLARKILRRTRFGNCDGKSPSSPEKKSSRHTKRGTNDTRSSISLKSPKYKKSGILSEYHALDHDKNAVDANVDSKNSPRKVGVVSMAKKLSFKRGKVLELRPTITSPRRLNFKRRVGDRQAVTVKTTESNLKNTQVSVNDGEIAISKSEHESIVLKHQGIEEKKAMQNMNNMIEETANKLAESRKSKVKALVGAFETVISHQDSRPSSSADAD